MKLYYPCKLTIMEKIKIILVDDHQIVRDGIKSLLSESSEVEIIDEANNAVELFKILKEKVPDIILLDISLPGMSGIEVAKRIKVDFPGIRILMLSMYTSEDFIFNALKSGVMGYLPKNTTRDELLTAINEISSGGEYFSKSISDTILKSYVNTAKHGGEITNDKLDNLTNREKEILHYVLEGNNNSNIANQLCISIRTVETHKSSIMRKLDLGSTVDLIKFAIKNNLIDL